MAPNRTQLQNLMQKSGESFKGYAQRWRELAARVQPPMMERELIDLFMGTLQGPYYERMIGNTSAGFSDLVLAGERVETGIKLGKIQNVASSSGVKKPYIGAPKKREGETSDVSSYRGGGRNYQVPYQQAASVTIPAPQPQQQQNFQRKPYQITQRRERHFDTPPMSYAQLLPHLLQL